MEKSPRQLTWSYKWGPGSAIVCILSDLEHKEVQEKRTRLDLDPSFPSLEPRVLYEREEKTGYS